MSVLQRNNVKISTKGFSIHAINKIRTAPALPGLATPLAILASVAPLLCFHQQPKAVSLIIKNNLLILLR